MSTTTKPKPTTASDAKPKLTILEQAEAYIRNKCRNHYKNLLRDCEKQDFLNAGAITQDQFVAVLARCQGTRLSKDELAAIHKKYQKTDTKRWKREEERGIDYIKLRDLFRDWFKNNDMEDPKLRSKAEGALTEAQKYLKFQFRNNYRQIFNVFRALDTHNTGALSYEVFQRLLSLYGGVRMTKDEWWGFSKMVDQNGDGKISYDEFGPPGGISSCVTVWCLFKYVSLLLISRVACAWISRVNVIWVFRIVHSEALFACKAGLDQMGY